ncbi:FadR/GntR family transcriptional regulator [Alteribacillus sp. JSM 102045]|uniref:FadR/GntR family transcriptional regulator n=1 Tax=Alteribacillus sp. JSM 102045 TaxID=1562101 RepID=UPI0035BF0BA0
MKKSPIKKQRVYKIVIDKIKESLKNGELQPGEKLPSERELTNLFDVSRSSIREAISVLEAEGVVKIRPGIGVFLVPYTKEYLLEKLSDIFQLETNDYLIKLLELRQGIESQAAYYAAKRRNHTQLQHLEAALNDLKNILLNNQHEVEKDFNFHNQIVKASQNEMMIESLDLISGRIIQGLRQSGIYSMELPGRNETLIMEHIDIFESIKNGEPYKAHQAMHYHLEMVIKDVLGRDE